MESAVIVRSAPWQIEVAPKRGGRITSLKLDGEELLDQGIGVDRADADGFVEGGAWGWDEMVPNVAAVGELPDHGEAWRLAWDVMRVTQSEIAMRCRGRIVPWELSRSVQLRDSLMVQYEYRNVGAQPHHAYWCAHPLFRYEAGMEVGLPGGAPHVGEGESTKLFLDAGAVDRVRLRWPSGLGVEMSWDSAVTPYVGVWLCNGDLGGYRQVAIEPATGGNDRPDPAAPPPLLPPGETLNWWLAIRPL